MTTTIEQYPIKNRFTGEVMFMAEIDVTPDMLPSIKLGLAVKWGAKEGKSLARADLTGANLAGAYLAGANLTDANLTDAYLAGAYLTVANLTGAYLTGANLTGANLTGAKNINDEMLRPIIADYWFILSRAQREVPNLIAALKAGKVNGSAYTGDCACLVGTLENAGASGLPHVSTSPAEQWFMAIKEGDRPGGDGAGGFAATKALQWAEEYCAATGLGLALVGSAQ